MSKYHSIQISNNQSTVIKQSITENIAIELTFPFFHESIKTTNDGYICAKCNAYFIKIKGAREHIQRGKKGLYAQKN